MVIKRHNDSSKIFALGRLYEFCSRKQFHLIENEFLKDDIGKEALELNNQIRIQSGIDLFEAKTNDDLLSYEKVLNQFTTTFSDEIVRLEAIGDEINLLRSEISFSIDKIKTYKLSILKQYKEHLKKFNIIVPTMLSDAKTPDYCSYVPEFNSFFATKKMKLKNKERILVYHLTPGSPYRNQMYSPRAGTRDLKFISSATLGDEFDIVMFFIFKFEDVRNLIDRPVSLFIKGLDLYGRPIEINGVLKKFHSHTVLPPSITSENIISFIDSLGRKDFQTVAQFRPSNIAIEILYMYEASLKKHADDFLSGRI